MTENDTAYEGLEAIIKDQLELAYGSMNEGFEEWKRRRNDMYLATARFNLYGHAATLGQYEAMAQQLFQRYDLRFEGFQNLIIRGTWAAARYTVSVHDRKTGEDFVQSNMDFIEFTAVEGTDPVRAVEAWMISDKPLNVHQ